MTLQKSAQDPLSPHTRAHTRVEGGRARAGGVARGSGAPGPVGVGRETQGDSRVRRIDVAPRRPLALVIDFVEIVPHTKCRARQWRGAPTARNIQDVRAAGGHSYYTFTDA